MKENVILGFFISGANAMAILVCIGNHNAFLAIVNTMMCIFNFRIGYIQLNQISSIDEKGCDHDRIEQTKNKT